MGKEANPQTSGCRFVKAFDDNDPDAALNTW